MDKSQMFGLLIIAGALTEMTVFFIGVIRRSYLALAIPLMFSIGAVNLLAVWVGWTMLTTEPEMPDNADLEEFGDL
jgi:multisubunit Na+/H+ antiporter MnhC subunit